MFRQKCNHHVRGLLQSGQSPSSRCFGPQLFFSNMRSSVPDIVMGPSPCCAGVPPELACVVGCFGTEIRGVFVFPVFLLTYLPQSQKPISKTYFYHYHKKVTTLTKKTQHLTRPHTSRRPTQKIDDVKPPPTHSTITTLELPPACTADRLLNEQYVEVPLFLIFDQLYDAGVVAILCNKQKPVLKNVIHT